MFLVTRGGDLIAMNRRFVRTVLILLLCMGLCVGAASAFSSSWLELAKKSIPSYFNIPWPATTPADQIIVQRFPVYIKPGDELVFAIKGDLKEGQKLVFAIHNGQLITNGKEFIFNITDVLIPAVAKNVSPYVEAQPVSWLRIERMEGGEVATLESSSPDAGGRIILTVSGINEDTQVHDYMSVKGTPTNPLISLNMHLEGVLMEDLHDVRIPFRVAESDSGSFTIVISIDGNEKLRQRIYVL
jgi:hypothetical protein